jgi:hypothetical protein
MKNCDAWISIGLMGLKYTDYFSAGANTTSVTSLDVTQFNGAKYRDDYNSIVVAANKNYIDYIAGKNSQAAIRFFAGLFTDSGIPECPPDATPEERYSCNWPPCDFGYVSPNRNCDCYKEQKTIGAGISKLALDCSTLGWGGDTITNVATCHLPLKCTGGGCHGGCNTWWDSCKGRILGYCIGGAVTNCTPVYCDPVTCNDGPKTKGRFDADNHNCPWYKPDYIDGLCYESCGDGWNHVPGAPTQCNVLGAADKGQTYRRFICQ